jgi:AcrR family transcriptional regulator
MTRPNESWGGHLLEGSNVSSTNSLTVEDLGSAAQRDRRKRILDATIALATQGGFDAVQMRAVAEQADVALGTLYRYFPSKIHLLVSALGREFERASASIGDRPIPGDTSSDRVIYVLRKTTRGLQGDPHLAEALTRAFMFADASVQAEIHNVGMLLTRMLTRAMHPSQTELTDDDVAIARVIGDVWLSTLVGWVTGRTSAADTAAQMEKAVHLLLRD